MMGDRELVVSVRAIEDGYVRLGLLHKAPLLLVGYDSGRFAVVYLAPISKGHTHPVEVASSDA